MHGGHQVDLALSTSAQQRSEIFVSEVVLKIVARGAKPHHYFTDPEVGKWNSFDFVIVAGSTFSNVAMMRLVRLLKVLGEVRCRVVASATCKPRTAR